MVNEWRMYLQIIAYLVAIVSGLLANMETLKARTLTIDNESIGSQERYYRAWLTPVYMWSLHYLMLMVFAAAVMFTLCKAGSAVRDQTESFDRAARLYERQQLAAHQRQRHENQSSSLASSLMEPASQSTESSEMLLHADAVKSNFFQGRPSDEANALNHGMVKTFMTFSQAVDLDSDSAAPRRVV